MSGAVDPIGGHSVTSWGWQQIDGDDWRVWRYSHNGRHITDAALPTADPAVALVILSALAEPFDNMLGPGDYRNPDTFVRLGEIGKAANRWRDDHHPTSTTWPLVLNKATEELGELARALLAEHEHRPGRGDPIEEAAQLVIVIASLVQLTHPGTNLGERIIDHLRTYGALP